MLLTRLQVASYRRAALWHAGAHCMQAVEARNCASSPLQEAACSAPTACCGRRSSHSSADYQGKGGSVSLPPQDARLDQPYSPNLLQCSIRKMLYRFSNEVLERHELRWLLAFCRTRSAVPVLLYPGDLTSRQQLPPRAGARPTVPALRASRRRAPYRRPCTCPATGPHGRDTAPRRRWRQWQCAFR